MPTGALAVLVLFLLSEAAGAAVFKHCCGACQTRFCAVRSAFPPLR